MTEAAEATNIRRNSVALLIGLLLILGLFQAWHELESSRVAIERFRLSDSFKTPVIRFFPPLEQRNGVVAVLVHGLHCNKAMMSQLARYLAAGGTDAYSIDLPGHGESRETFSEEKGLAAAQAAVSKLIERTDVPAEKLVLIGHSFGAVALGPAALSHDLLAAVFIGPGKPDGLSRRLPNNALIVTGEHDYDHVKQYAQALYDDLTARDRLPPGNLVGDFQQNDARLWEVLPGATHLSLLLDPHLYQLVAQWIERSTRGSIPVQSSYSTGPAKRAVGLALALFLVLTVLMASIVQRYRRIPISDPIGHWALPAIAAIGGLYFSVLLINGLISGQTPLGLVRLEEKDVLTLLLAATGILGLALFVSLGGAISCRLAAVDLIVAALVFFSLYGLALLTIDGEFYNLRIALGDWRRLLTLGIVALLAAPSFLLQEELLRRLQGAFGRGIRGFAIYCGGYLLLAVIISGSLHFVDARLYRFDTQILGVLVYCAFVGAILRAALKNTVAGILFSSLVCAWIISVGFFHSY